MNILVLTNADTTSLLDAIKRFYITEDFSWMLSSLAKNLAIAEPTPEMTHGAFLSVGKLIMANSYRYYENNTVNTLVSLLMSGWFHKDLYVPYSLVSDFRQSYASHLAQEYHPEAERLVKSALVEMAEGVESCAKDKFFEAHVKLIEAYQTYVPGKNINVHRFEFTPYLKPMLFFNQPREHHHERV